MKAWESAEWFVKWLELARVEMGEAAAENHLSEHTGQEAHAESPFGCTQLGATEEHKLAA
jgi:hypothetical protein